jgi:hypothetical protein
MPDSARSITAIKTSFFAAQVKLLNRPLQLADEPQFTQDIPVRELKHALKEGGYKTCPESSRLTLLSQSPAAPSQ